MGKPIIKKLKETKKTKISDIDPGITFIYAGNICIMSNDFNIIDLANGNEMVYDEDELVESIQITITY